MRIILRNMGNTMAADTLVMRGARSSEATVLTMYVKSDVKS